MTKVRHGVARHGQAELDQPPFDCAKKRPKLEASATLCAIPAGLGEVVDRRGGGVV